MIRHLLAATPGAAMHYVGKYDPASPMLQEEEALARHLESPRLASRAP